MIVSALVLQTSEEAKLPPREMPTYSFQAQGSAVQAIQRALLDVKTPFVTVLLDTDRPDAHAMNEAAASVLEFEDLALVSGADRDPLGKLGVSCHVHPRLNLVPFFRAAVWPFEANAPAGASPVRTKLLAHACEVLGALRTEDIALCMRFLESMCLLEGARVEMDYSFGQFDFQTRVCDVDAFRAYALGGTLSTDVELFRTRLVSADPLRAEERRAIVEGALTRLLCERALR